MRSSCQTNAGVTERTTGATGRAELGTGTGPKVPSTRKAAGSSEPCGVLLLDKPPGYSSTQALGRAKRMLAASKAGHTGTLDPFATGLLPIAFGEATKFSRFLIEAPKSYLATLVLGEVTPTGDTEGEVTERREPERDTARIDHSLEPNHRLDRPLDGFVCESPRRKRIAP